MMFLLSSGWVGSEKNCFKRVSFSQMLMASWNCTQTIISINTVLWPCFLHVCVYTNLDMTPFVLIREAAVHDSVLVNDVTVVIFQQLADLTRKRSQRR